MNAKLSREVGRIMGKAIPSPTDRERDIVLRGMQVASSIEEMPSEARAILDKLRKGR